MEFKDLRYERDGHIATITLDRPQARNAYSVEMVDSLIAALDAAEADREIRCVILTGAGSSFSGGGDLRMMQERTGLFEGDQVELRSSYIRGIQRIPRRFARFDKPVIAAVNGPAIGAGLDLACMADIRISAHGARFGSTFVKVGLVPGDGGAYLLARTIGFPKALELVMTGRLIDTLEAEQIGLINESVESEELMETARQWADRIAANAPLAVRLTKSAAYASWDLPFEAALNLAATYQGVAQNTDDHEEGVKAVLERRPADFKG